MSFSETEITPGCSLITGDKNEPMTYSDLRLANRALKERWPISEADREELVKQMSRIIRLSKKSGLKILAARALIAADAMNVQQERIDKPVVHSHEHTVTIGRDLEARRARILAQLTKDDG